jgi:secondary thiamine-phosphate synthase enzyme
MEQGKSGGSMTSFSIETRTRTEFVDITREVAEAVATKGTRAGTVTVFVPHTTAGVTINENADPDVMHDMALALDRMVPWDLPAYKHGEGNSAAHVKATLTGSSVRVIVQNGALQLGTWQGIYFCEYDGPRTRQVWVECG